MFGMIKNSLFGGTEVTEYKLLSSETKEGINYEVRRYDSARYASVCTEGRSFDQAASEGVKRLLMYKGGSNDRGVGMGVTVPVAITVFTRDDGAMSRRFVIGLRIPSRYQDNPPAPTDSSVKIEDRPGMTVYALQFGGFAGEYEFRIEASRLTRILGETAPYQRKQYFCCSYDPPIKPYGRRNEVWFIQEEP
ncbi:hypothetical protein COCON_G00209190 [Conger conger]|uniref:Heme-binding protein 1 n=1 Tax=Conger conger TaxID=82655 RepID=A0A9Q1D0Y1_CONCO|nr:heme-binding protein 1-like [Conger conger]KAJ8254307.1 hypothetical protein COCON_G00209190 [Conger conger]